ncbi:low-specificity L-threonine aldolase [Salinispirillum sp. LH 10-3-1]|uniref:Low-specificity L-threonine aldolase n=1 Tax=Salinispirillum sp. LH 10-3-1 TaxID=2952525 RepID=A0AB38YJ06_9GAMM
MSDFRSDTVTQPSVAMKEAMMAAPLGDDVFGSDPTVNALQTMAAEMLGYEAALFAPSGTQTNLIALMSHCQRGDEAIVGQDWHTYRWEAGGMAVLGSIQPQPVANQPDGSLALADIAGAIKPDDMHFARTRLLVIENTVGGQVLSAEYMQAAAELAKSRGLATHIDGARLFNAAVSVAQEDGSDPIATARRLCQGYDSVSICLSKGLGAPVGSLLLGSHELIKRARRVRKMLGGGMRQAGILAAAGHYALQNNVHRLAEDHLNILTLASELRRVCEESPLLKGKVVVHSPNTNILFMDVQPDIAQDLLAYLAADNVLVTNGYHQAPSGQMVRIRWVTHMDVGDKDISKAIQAVSAFSNPVNGGHTIQ